MKNINNHLADFQFIGKSIKKLSVSNAFANTNDTDAFSRSIDVDYKIVDISEKDTKRTALMHLTVNVNLSREDNSTDIKYVVEGCFTVPIEVSKEEFITMLSVNGCTALYSVARADISSISSHIFNSGKILLPMVNVWELVNSEKSK